MNWSPNVLTRAGPILLSHLFLKILAAAASPSAVAQVQTTYFKAQLKVQWDPPHVSVRPRPFKEMHSYARPLLLLYVLSLLQVLIATGTPSIITSAAVSSSQLSAGRDFTFSSNTYFRYFTFTY